jgi:glutamine cyclotransferase
MRIKYLKSLFPFTVLLLSTWAISCSGRTGQVTVKEGDKTFAKEEAEPVRLIKMISPDENSEFPLHSPIHVILDTENKNQLPDSVVISFNGKRVAVVSSAPWDCLIPGGLTVSTGRRSLKATAYKKGKAGTTITRFMIIISDITPKRYSFRVVHSYPHDRDAFTQGLFYDHGVLYEGTGQEAGSSLREVELATGKVIRQLNLPSNLFGEGITLYKDRIYQVTWTSKIGFVYEKSTFKQINKIYYQTQGWGLTTIGDQIVMSDGTNALYFFEPEMFTVVSRLEVYDNEKKVDQLNELEYINGEIWANIWMTDLIARIDPVSGKVLGYIDLKGILNDPDTDTSVKVLNGIAFDREDNRIFVTGKNWPKLFEIKVTE